MKSIREMVQFFTNGMNRPRAFALIAVTIVALACSTFEQVLRDDVVVDTRGIPIVQMIIEGPGGDLVPVEFDRSSRLLIHFDGVAFITVIGIIVGTLSVIYFLILPEKMR